MTKDILVAYWLCIFLGELSVQIFCPFLNQVISLPIIELKQCKFSSGGGGGVDIYAIKGQRTYAYVGQGKLWVQGWDTDKLEVIFEKLSAWKGYSSHWYKKSGRVRDPECRNMEIC